MTRLATFLLAFLLAAPAYAETCTHTISVSGNELLRDGSPWQLHGMNSLVVLSYPSQAGSSYKNAQTVWNADGGATDIAQLKSWGADTVRLQMAQPSLDPFSPNYDPTYESYIAGVVQKWCGAGLSVILSMQASALSAGWNQPFDFATDATYRAWQNLAPIWLSEPNVIIELFNEPSNSDNYNNGGGDTTPPHRSPTNNQWQDWVDNANWLMARLRAAGSVNVFGVDGIGSAHFLAGGPTTFSGDPSNEWFYVAHIYPLENATNNLVYKNFTPDFMEFAWGAMGVSKPMVADEWADGTNGAGNQYCYDSTSGTPGTSLDVATRLLTYLQDAAQDSGVLVTNGDYFQSPIVTNTGTGSIFGASRGASVVHGNYTVAMTSTTSATVTDPNGTNFGTAAVGTPFTSSEINFTLNSAPAATDKFVLTVPTHSLIGLVPFNWEGHVNPANWTDDYTTWTPTYFYTSPFSCSGAPVSPANSPGYLVQQYFLNPSAPIVSPTTPPP